MARGAAAAAQQALLALQYEGDREQKLKNLEDLECRTAEIRRGLPLRSPLLVDAGTPFAETSSPAAPAEGVVAPPLPPPSTLDVAASSTIRAKEAANAVWSTAPPNDITMQEVAAQPLPPSSPPDVASSPPTSSLHLDSDTAWPTAPLDGDTTQHFSFCPHVFPRRRVSPPFPHSRSTLLGCRLPTHLNTRKTLVLSAQNLCFLNTLVDKVRQEKGYHRQDFFSPPRTSCGFSRRNAKPP